MTIAIKMACQGKVSFKPLNKFIGDLKKKRLTDKNGNTTELLEGTHRNTNKQ